jgi:hypothetical protein
VHAPHTIKLPELIWGLHVSLAKAKIVHMALSLRLSFQLSHSLRIYTVHTTAVFRVTTKEALA